MAEDQQGERTEEATQTRREEFRKRGQLAHSRELSSALFMIVAFLGIIVLGRFFLENLMNLLETSFGSSLMQMAKNGDVLTAVKIASQKFTVLILPVLGISLIIGVGSSLIQIGFIQVEDAISPDFERLNPLAGMKRLFSFRNVIEAVKAILKFIVIGAIIYSVLKFEFVKIPILIQGNVNELLSYMNTISAKLFGGVGLALAALTVGDYFFQRWDLEKRMMMTKDEIKRESKEREGDPLIKSRIRRVQRELANKRMMEKVPQADVIITNPTHIAVALKYDENLPAPQLIAKGADLIAEKIKEIAKNNRIPIVENKPLARTIFKTLKLGQVVPRELFVAVAEVLSYVYRLKKKKAKH